MILLDRSRVFKIYIKITWKSNAFLALNNYFKARLL
jgi:hypothetical protein